MNTTKKQKILNDLKADYKAAKELRNSLDTKIAKWKREYDGEPYGNEVKNRSELVSRDIKKYAEWEHAGLIEPFVSTPDIVKTSPVTWEDAQKAPNIEIVSNTQFCRQFNRYNFMDKSIKVLQREGTIVVRTGWDYAERMVVERQMIEQPNPEFIQAQQAIQQGMADPNILSQIPPSIEVPKEVEVVKPIKNQPTAMVCRNEDVFIDPTCQDDMDKCQFVIYRYESDLNSLKKAGVYSNLDQINMEGSGDNEYRQEDKTEFKFQDKLRKKLVVHEYWGNYDIDDDGKTEPIVCTWVGDTIIRLQDNPFPDRLPPFIVVPFNRIPFTMYGEPNAELLSDVQKIKTAIIRGIIDNMALSNNAQKGIRKGALDISNKKRFLRGDNFEFNFSANDFYDGNFNELPSSVFNVLQLMNDEGESITGVKSFSQGINSNSLGASATGIRGVIDSASSRRLNIVRNISENLVKPLIRKWLAYSSEFLDEEAQFRITNDEFVWIKRDDLGASIDIDLNISTSDDNQAKANELVFLLQTIGPNEDPEIRKKLMIKIAQLYKMPDLAHELQTYEPQPDPFTQQMQALQLQMLQAQIKNEDAKGEENKVDVTFKAAKTETEKAKSANLRSQADKTDLDYIQQYHGVNNKAKKEEQSRKHQYDMDKEMLKLIENSTNNKYL